MKLQHLINPQLFLDIEGGKLRLVEDQNKDNSDSLYWVEVQSIPENAFAFSMDTLIEVEENGTGKKIKEKARNHFLSIPTSANPEDAQEHKRINKCCDAILAILREGEVDLYFFEMKSEMLEAGKYEHQLINSKLFMDYLLNLYNAFYGEKYGKVSLGKYRFVLLHRDKLFDADRSIRRTPFETMKLHVHEKIMKKPQKKSLYNFIDFLKDLG